MVNKESHLASETCRKGAEKRSNFLHAIRQERATEITFSVDGQPINRVTEFKYLGRILEENDDDDHAALRQLARAREKWGRMSRLLSTQCASLTTRGHFYKAIIQAVLLYSAELLVTKQAGYYGEPFRAKCGGVRQGNILSPMIFNIIADCVLRAWDVAMPGDRGSLFYADDRVLYGNNGPELQRNLDFFSDSLTFRRQGRKASKTHTTNFLI